MKVTPVHPDYSTIESLLRAVLDEMRQSMMLMAKDATGDELGRSLEEATKALRDIDDLIERDPIAAYAAGKIGVRLLAERIESMMRLNRACGGRGIAEDMSDEIVAAIARSPGLPRGFAASRAPR